MPPVSYCRKIKCDHLTEDHDLTGRTRQVCGINRRIPGNIICPIGNEPRQELRCWNTQKR